MEQRVLFKKGKQREFLNLVKERLFCPSLKSILQYGFDVSYSVLKDYNIEKILLPKEFFIQLCHIAKLNPHNFNARYVENNWGQIKGGKKGIKVILEKYPEEIKKWRRLGQQNSPVIGVSNCKKIKIPELDEKLAEFIGAYLGDGTLTPYQLKIAGDYRYDFFYYKYLSKLVFNLFGIYPRIGKVKDRNTSILLISSKNLCSFLNKKFGLKYGHKIRNKATIPKQILENEKLTIACLRGLIDTDGSISRRGREGSQFCIQFTSHNKYLLNQVNEIGKRLGIFTFCDKTGAGTNKWVNIEKYFKIVGSSNLRHIIRFHLRKFKNKTIYQKDIPNYYGQDLYKNLNLPFKISGT